MQLDENFDLVCFQSFQRTPRFYFYFFLSFKSTRVPMPRFAANVRTKIYFSFVWMGIDRQRGFCSKDDYKRSHKSLFSENVTLVKKKPGARVCFLTIQYIFSKRK